MSGSGVAASALLAPDETALLGRALLEWGGPARCGDQLAVGMGFESERDLIDQCLRLRRALVDDVPVAPVDWARILLAVEIVFVSDLVGTGYEWPTTTGLSDEATIRSLRSIQRKLGTTVRSYYGETPSDA